MMAHICYASIGIIMALAWIVTTYMWDKVCDVPSDAEEYIGIIYGHYTRAISIIAAAALIGVAILGRG